MKSRTVRDAYFQELVTNGKNTIALIPPKSCDDSFSLEVYYPDERYYKWIENKILDDSAFITVVASFPEIKGWIDTDRDNEGQPPAHSVEALNAVALVVVQKLEAAGLHGMVYGRQLWGEIASVLPNPNSIVVSVLNPFNNVGDMAEERTAEIQAIVDQLNEGDTWLEMLKSGFDGRIIRLVQESFDISFLQSKQQSVRPEISLPDWGSFKTSMLEAVTCHNFDLFMTGMIREIYHAYIKHIYKTGFDDIYYADDLPKFSYGTLNEFLPIWEIIRRLSLSEEKEME
jgi:hypothetical protein